MTNLKITKLIKNYNSQLFVNEYGDNEGYEHDDNNDDDAVLIITVFDDENDYQLPTAVILH